MKYVIEDLHPQSAISAEAKPSMTQVPVQGGLPFGLPYGIP